MSSSIIFPRSSRETMNGWSHLPRYVDKIRLHLAGLLDAGYRNNLGKGFDGMWLEAAGATHEQMVEVVKNSLTDGQVCDWVRANVDRPASEKEAHRARMLDRPMAGNDEQQARFQARKAELGFSHRADITNFVDLNDADEKRL